MNVQIFSYHLGVFSDQYNSHRSTFDEKDYVREFTFNGSIFGCCLAVWLIVYFISSREIDWVSLFFFFFTEGCKSENNRIERH